MNNGIAGTPRPKIDALATGINRLIADLITLCEVGEDKPRNCFDVGVIGYTTDRNDPPNPIVGSVLAGEQGTLAGRDLVSLSDLFDDPLAVEDRQKMADDGQGGLMSMTFRVPVWYRRPSKEAMGGRPMCAAFHYVYHIAASWCAAHPNSFPPMVIHLTDGESDDGDPVPFANALESLLNRRRRAPSVQLLHLGVAGEPGRLPQQRGHPGGRVGEGPVPDVERAAGQAARGGRVEGHPV